jgi:hypothetical protein
MAKKIAGRLNHPPGQPDFDPIPLAGYCVERSGVFVRLHSINRATGAPWDPVHFSRRATSRFDPKGGVGALYLAESLPGALMELFDDHWDAAGGLGRSVTEQQLSETWVSLVSLPEARLFDATGGNLSLIGADAQLTTGHYPTTRRWAARLMSHPDSIDGILFRSRHDQSRLNVALFGRNSFQPAVADATLAASGGWHRNAGHGTALVHGPAILLRDHLELPGALVALQVARIP